MKKLETDYFVIGYSVASWWCIQSIRENDSVGFIQAVSDEKTCYSRPLITYGLGRTVDSIAYQGKVEELTRMQIGYEARVERLDPRRKLAFLTDGTEISFEKALIASGGVPIIPEISGGEHLGIFTFTRQKDMENIATFMHKNSVKNIVILGGGFIGLKTCEAMMNMNKNITLIELAPRLLQNMLDEEGSYYLEKSLLRSGVHIIKEDTIVSFEEEKGILSDVLLKSGRRIPADIAIIAIGVRPNVDWLRSSGIEMNRGIVVDEFQESSCSGIYAAGDVAETRHLLTGERNVVAIWPEAVNQGRIAGWNMSGRVVSYPGSLPMNAVEVGEKALVSAGIVNPLDDNCEIIIRKDRENYKKLVIKDNCIIGVIFIGDIEKSGIYINLMRQKLPVQAFYEKLLEPNFGLINLPTQYRKHFVKGAGIEV
ncbi:MAG: FAD-dependent oxidoreductase [Candidatus Atribacteria bacterium]|nr:FAD-dependent oxidoreductase [Candidatus Atribacteria bacterium]